MDLRKAQLLSVGASTGFRCSSGPFPVADRNISPAPFDQALLFTIGRPHSTCIRASFATRAHFASSALTCFANTSGALPTGSEPSFAS